MASRRIRKKLTFDATFSEFRFKCFDNVVEIIKDRINYINNLNDNELKKLLSQDDINFYFSDDSIFEKEMKSIETLR